MPIILPWPQSATDCRWMLCQARGQNSVDENTDVDENMGGCWRKDDVMLTKIFDPRRPLTCGNIRQHMSTGYFRQQNFFSSPPPPPYPPLKRVRIIGWFLGRFLGLVVDHNHETFSLWGGTKEKILLTQLRNLNHSNMHTPSDLHKHSSTYMSSLCLLSVYICQRCI